MIHSIEDWRKELRDVDAQLIALLQRRLDLAIELLQVLHTDELTLGDLELDTLSLGVLLQSEYEGDLSLLDEAATKKIFRRIVIETRRLAYLSIAAHEKGDASLTPREREILILIAEDHSLKRIALKLNISTKTVESHKAAIMRKLKIYSAIGLALYAIREGLTSL